MSFSSLVNIHTFDGNGVTTHWPYTFPIISEDGSDIKVYITTPLGVTTLITTGYTVDVDAGEVIYPTLTEPITDPMPADYQITLLRVEDLTQLIDLLTQGIFDAEVIETGFDKLTMICQQLKEELGRCLKLPVVGASYETGSEEAAMAYAQAAQAAKEAAEDAQAAAETAETNAETAETNAETAQAAAEAAQAAAEAATLGALDTDGTLAANSDTKIATQKATKTYVDTKVPVPMPTTLGGTGSTVAANAAGGVVVPAGAVNAANGALVLNASAQIPAVSGALLTNLPVQAPTAVSDTDAGTGFDYTETTFLSVTKTITAGHTVLLITTGYIVAGQPVTALKLKQGSTIVQTLSGYPITGGNYALSGIVTGLSGSVTFSVTAAMTYNWTGTAYGNLEVIEF